MSRYNLFTLLLIFVAACGEVTNTGNEELGSFRVRKGLPGPQTKIFLIAGSRDNANFAQEVIDQKKYWLSKGYSQKQIACYYVLPAQKGQEDVAQFNALAKDLESCFFADPKIIHEHLLTLSRSTEDSMYFYLTSHGNSPYKSHYENFDLETSTYKNKVKISRRLQRTEWVEPFTITIEGLLMSNGETLIANTMQRIAHFAEDMPESVDEHLFTSKNFKRTLDALPRQMKKHIVLQACFSGGFILPEDPSSLAHLPNSIVMTAARSDRTSFGCDSGGHKTYFDDAYSSTLRDLKIKRYDTIDWNKAHKIISRKIEQMESSMKISVPERSLPQFIAN